MVLVQLTGTLVEESAAFTGQPILIEIELNTSMNECYVNKWCIFGK